MDYVGDILAIIGILAGAGSFISMLVSVLKLLGVIKDGDSGKVAKVLDLVVFAGVAVIYFLHIEVDWSNVNAYFVLAAYVIGLVGQIFSSEITYQALKGTPVIGYSFDEKPKG